jgi:hypothetical protein
MLALGYALIAVSLWASDDGQKQVRYALGFLVAMSFGSVAIAAAIKRRMSRQD